MNLKLWFEKQERKFFGRNKKMRGDIINRVYYKREKEASKLRIAGGSWTILVDEILDKRIDTFVYYTETSQYRISRKLAHENGFELTLGGEKKLVVPLKFWLKEALIDSDQERINRAFTI